MARWSDTLTVEELIEDLQQHPPDLKVVYLYDGIHRSILQSTQTQCRGIDQIPDGEDVISINE